jgi:hypothetical protein
MERGTLEKIYESGLRKEKRLLPENLPRRVSESKKRLKE